jgi:hypothetical protein
VNSFLSYSKCINHSIAQVSGIGPFFVYFDGI